MGTRRHAAAAQSGLLLAVIEDDLAAVQRELAQPSPQWVSAEGGLSALHLAAGFAGPAVLAALLAVPSLPPGLVDAQLQADYTSQNVFEPLLESAVTETRLAFRAGTTALHIAVYFGDAGELPCTLPPCGSQECNAPACCASQLRHAQFLHPQTLCACCWVCVLDPTSPMRMAGPRATMQHALGCTTLLPAAATTVPPPTRTSQVRVICEPMICFAPVACLYAVRLLAR